MKRRPLTFYRDFADLRKALVRSGPEYNRQDWIRAGVPLLNKSLTEADELALDVLRDIADGIESKENNPLQGELFSYDAHAALGDGKRIPRSEMTFDHLSRRKKVIDDNHEKQNASWGIENKWLTTRQAALRGFPSETTVKDVMNEDGTPNIRPAA